jgi:primosomal protein N' (replication factor Y)
MADFADVLLLDLPIDRTFTYRIPPALRDRVRPGVRVTAPFRGRRETGFVARLSDRSEVPRVLDLLEADAEPLLDEKLMDLARWVAERYVCSWGEALAAALPSGVKKASPARFVRLVSAGDGEGRTPRQKEILEAARRLAEPLPLREFVRRTGASASTVSALLRAGLLRETLERPQADLLSDPPSEPRRDIRLTPEQEAALEEVSRPGVVLLHGITGSGKTEVYLRAIERVVAAGRQAIVLVPEIALTPQTVSRFRGRFSRVAVLHSVLSEADRAAQWRAARAGEVDVIVGARSAVFAPVRSLGLIVLDEEHEGAYKQESVPRYHAREVAVERARREGATVILGSATPSLESLHRARTGAYRLVRLPARVEGRPLPEIEVVDMTAEQAELKRRAVISRRLEQRARAALERGERVILFLNRRGFLTHVSCARCGWFFHCRRCDVAMTYHRREDRAVCHYCADAQPLPASCPACRGGKLVQYGQGTERVEAEIRRIFPGFAVARMDSDSMRTRRDYRESLSAFREGRTDILVGTQMIAKGLDVPEVTLVGVVNADTAFHVPDFRAAERTFQLITQVAGRAGRGPRGGRVVVQTFFPRHDAIRAAASYDFAGFVARELEHRREAGYPPFVSLVRLVVQGREEKRVEEAAEEAGRRLREALPEPRAQVLGPAKAPLYRIRGRYRRHLLVKAPDLESVLPDLRRLAASFPRTSTLQVAVDVDPASLL